MLDVLALVIQTPKCLPPLVWGPPGIGKTARVQTLAKVLELPMEVVIGSIREPQDFSGLVIPKEDGLHCEPPPFARRLAEAKKGLLFLDEMSCAPPAVQAAMLRLTLEKTVGDLTLPDDVKIVACANPPDQAAGGWDLALPLANRFVHLRQSSPSAKEWGDWLLGQSDGTEDIPKLDLEKWEKCFSRSKTLFAGFVRKNGDMLAEDIDKVAGRFPAAFSTPRTMECASRLYATTVCAGRTDLQMALLMGAIGEGVATQFLAWVRDADLPDPEDLIKSPTSWKPDPKRPDVTFTVLNSVAIAAVETSYSAKEKLVRWRQAWKVMKQAVGQGKDLVIMAAKTLAKEQNRPAGGLNDPEVKDMIMSLRDVVRDSGAFSS